MGAASIEFMSKDMGVTKADVLSLANMVATSLTKDGMIDIFIGMSDEERINTTCAYAATEVKKFNDFCVSLLTNTEKKSAFDQYIFYKLNKSIK